MMRYTRGSTVTTAEAGTSPKSGNICRLRLTLPAEGTSRPEHNETKNEKTLTVDPKTTAEKKKKKNGFVSEKNTSEPPTLHLYSVPKGNSAPGGHSHGVVYGVVQRAENNHQNEVVVYEWSTHQLKEEMNYIKDVRVTLEKIRERMFGEYDDMKEKIKQLTQEMKVSSVQQEVLENHAQAQASALDSFGTMNSSLTIASIEMQKTLVNMSLENCSIRDKVKNLQDSYDESLNKLKEKQKMLEEAQAENQALKVKIECSQEANADVMRELTRKVYNQYDEKIQQEELKYAAEKEALLEREQLQVQLTRHEERLQNLDKRITINSAERERTQHLEEAATSLRERIKHLDDMVHCQQKKVKSMIEEIELLRKKVHYKDLLIQQLLERIAFLEGENTELQDKMDYLLANQPKTSTETKDAETSCNLTNSVPVITPTTQSALGSTDDASSTETDARIAVQRSYTPYMRVLQLSMKNKVS
ncbi:myocardial zonula adherens -like isoform X1 [Pelobates cultripes]|uniref:Myocardial zonula adherens -like isoform X1 n=1 Tax=Pelobates cultripes TaxID=61616 RepID=A0AAD1RLM2_PELCU|nr:myocardial zonula adherens -like isoform X1 [Pelobates cultripes]